MGKTRGAYHLSSVARWLSWCMLAGRLRNWRMSSNQRRNRSGSGWRSGSATPVAANGGLTTAEREEISRLRERTASSGLSGRSSQRRGPVRSGDERDPTEGSGS